MPKILITIPDTISYAKAIRKKCLDCVCGQSKEVELCDMVDCPLFPYRFGCSPETIVGRKPNEFKVLEHKTVNKRKNKSD